MKKLFSTPNWKLIWTLGGDSEVCQDVKDGAARDYHLVAHQSGEILPHHPHWMSSGQHCSPTRTGRAGHPGAHRILLDRGENPGSKCSALCSWTGLCRRTGLCRWTGVEDCYVERRNRCTIPFYTGSLALYTDFLSEIHPSRTSSFSP